MDPNACLKDALGALIEAYELTADGRLVDAAGHVADAIGGLRNLAEWLERGGFLPDVDRVLDELR